MTLLAEQIHRSVTIFVDTRASGEPARAGAVIIPEGRSIEIRRGDRQAICIEVVAGTERLLANGAGCQQQQEQQHDRAHEDHLLMYPDKRSTAGACSRPLSVLMPQLAHSQRSQKKIDRIRKVYKSSRLISARSAPRVSTSSIRHALESLALYPAAMLPFVAKRNQLGRLVSPSCPCPRPCPCPWLRPVPLDGEAP